MHITFLLCALLLATPHATLGQADYVANAETAASPLFFKWYNLTSGLWDTTNWWLSANTMTTLGDLAAINPNAKDSASAIFSNSLVQAPNTHRDFMNDFYDDEGWWALGWINAYDITQKPEYLQTAVEIFEDMTGGWDTPCGGIWWDKKRTAVFAIANELFFSVAASLSNRKPDNRDYYLDWAHRSRDWFENSGLVNAQGVVNDGLNMATCENDGDTVWSYNQGVILGAYVELAKAAPNPSYLSDATSIARAAINNLSGSNQILHDVCEPRCDNTAAQFKGIFLRNLRILQQASPRPEFATFITKNADSIWANDRTISGSETLLGQVWSGPFVVPANATTQSSALDALVAAGAIAD
jgi:predicted alpha-1,6-mannanase (GH76 family)